MDNVRLERNANKQLSEIESVVSELISEIEYLEKAILEKDIEIAHLEEKIEELKNNG